MSTFRITTAWYMCMALLLLWSSQGRAQQQKPLISEEASSHHFGIIPEELGKVHHTFLLKNTYNSPLVVTRVAVDCGCTATEWPEEAIAPGEEIPIKVSFDPAGRPGTFVKYIRVYHQLNSSPVELSIKGNVSLRGSTSSTDALYRQKEGPLLISNKELYFSVAMPGIEHVLRFVVNNTGQDSVLVKLTHVPDYLTVSKTEFILGAQEPEELYVATQTTDQTHPGLLQDSICLEVTNLLDKTVYKAQIATLVPAIPSLELEGYTSPDLDLNTYVRLGSLSEMKKNQYNGALPMTNTGAKTLAFYDVKSDDPAVSILSYPKKLAPKEKGYIRYRIDRKRLQREQRVIRGNISLLLSDTNAPLRKIKLVIKPESQRKE